jgi:hypothetical protein
MGVQHVLFNPIIQMEFGHTSWTLKDLIDVYYEGNLNLSPPYQRNFIWSKRDQNELIDSIEKRNFPLPSFFLYKKPRGKYEMVDGQQRSRTIINYYKNTYGSQMRINKQERTKFETYKIPVTIIFKINKDENIEEFYARVNKTGLKLNKPELNKAQYFDTNFLALNEKLADLDLFKQLGIFTEVATNRMNDIEFTSELVAYLHSGIKDRKSAVDKLYGRDITKTEFTQLSKRFKSVIGKIDSMNEIYPISKTRFKQRSDFYTLFNFVNSNFELSRATFGQFYTILVLIGPDISPSNEFCEPFKEYARNCFTQSHSLQSRKERLDFFEQLLLGNSNVPNETQMKILKFYRMPSQLKKIGKYYSLDVEVLKSKKSSIMIDG